MSVGRISPTKRQLDVVHAFAFARDKVPAAILYIVGKPALKEDVRYLERIKEYIRKQKIEAQVKFLDAIPNKKMPPIYQKAAVTVNMSETGSLDKDVLEALSCGIPALTTNIAFKGVIPEVLIVEDGDAIGERLTAFLEEGPHKEKEMEYRNLVVRAHSLGRLISNLISDMQIV